MLDCSLHTHPLARSSRQVKLDSDKWKLLKNLAFGQVAEKIKTKTVMWLLICSCGWLNSWGEYSLYSLLLIILSLIGFEIVRLAKQWPSWSNQENCCMNASS